MTTFDMVQAPPSLRTPIAVLTDVIHLPCITTQCEAEMMKLMIQFLLQSLFCILGGCSPEHRSMTRCTAILSSNNPRSCTTFGWPATHCNPLISALSSAGLTSLCKQKGRTTAFALYDSVFLTRADARDANLKCYLSPARMS